MRYYEIRRDGKIVGCGSSRSMRRIQPRRRIALISDEDHAEMIEDDATGQLFRDQWMLQSTEATQRASLAIVMEIDVARYMELIDQLTLEDDGIPLPEPEPEEPAAEEEIFDDFTKNDVLDMLADLDMRVSMIEMGVEL